MTGDEFRDVALEMPGATEDSHMGHPDFRIHNRIFATLGPRPDHGMVKLPLEDQQRYVRDHGDAFMPINLVRGARKARRVILSAASIDLLRPAMAQRPGVGRGIDRAQVRPRTRNLPGGNECGSSRPARMAFRLRPVDGHGRGTMRARCCSCALARTSRCSTSSRCN